MIIDADTHLAPDTEDISFRVEERIKTMEYAGVDKALVWLTPVYSGIKGIEAYNRYVYESVTHYPNSFFGFGWADPTLGVEHAKDMAKRCVEEYGFHGVKLNGAQNNFYIDDPELAVPVAETIAKLGKPIAFHIGPDAYERTHPFRAANIARLFPEIPVLMVHMGMSDDVMGGAVVEMAEMCPNMYLIGSNSKDTIILNAVKRLGAERVCFGSDTPFRPMHVQVACYNALLRDRVTDSGKEKIMSGNLLTIFGIEGG